MSRHGAGALASAPSLVYLLLLIPTFALYGQLRHVELVDFDDLAYVSANPSVTAGLTFKSIRWAFTRAHEGDWSPLFRRAIDVTTNNYVAYYRRFDDRSR